MPFSFQGDDALKKRRKRRGKSNYSKKKLELSSSNACLSKILMLVIFLLGTVYLGLISAQYGFEAGYVKEEVSVVNHIRTLESRKYAAESKGIEVKSKLRKFGKLKSPTKNVVTELHNKPSFVIPQKASKSGVKHYKSLSQDNKNIGKQLWSGAIKEKQVEKKTNGEPTEDSSDADDQAKDEDDEKVGCSFPHEFELLENIDIKGGDPPGSRPIVGMRSHRDCCEKCVKSLGCVAFTYVPTKNLGSCYLKSYDGQKSRAAPSLGIISGELSKREARKKDAKLTLKEKAMTPKAPMKLGIQGKPPSTTVDMYGSRITIGIDRHRNLKGLQDYIVKQQYAYRIMKAALAVSHQSQIVIDVGANYGSFSLFALSFGAKEVLAFEPQDKVSTLLINRFFFF